MEEPEALLINSEINQTIEFKDLNSSTSVQSESLSFTTNHGVNIPDNYFEFKDINADLTGKPDTSNKLGTMFDRNLDSSNSHQFTPNGNATDVRCTSRDENVSNQKNKNNTSYSYFDLTFLNPADFELFVDSYFLEDNKLKTINYSSTRPNIADVVDLLNLQYVIITGGYSKDGCPIIVFQDKNNFQSLEEGDYEKLIMYLTSVPSLLDIDLGFHVIIDRRKDKWASVRFVLQRLSSFFPAMIQIVYVLRPEGLFQKAISEVSSKFSKEEYRFPVMICSNMDELHNIIDKSQLTEDLGGTLHFSLHEWIQQRKSLEKFSCLTNQVSSEMDIFIQEIRNQDFPNGLNACKELQENQMNKYEGLKERTLLVVKYGEILLSNFKATHENKEFSERMGNVSGLERLLVQLEETKCKFDDLWKSHQKHWQHYLLLQHFEEEFQSLQIVLNDFINQCVERSETGESIEGIQILLDEHYKFAQQCEYNIEKANAVIRTGTQLIDLGDVNVSDMITSKSNELNGKCQLLMDRIGKRQEILEKNFVLMERVDKANQWCTNGIELLASQRMDQLSFTTENAELNLKEIQLFITTAAEFGLSDPNKFNENFLEITTPDTKALVSQVLQRINDVSMMCDKRIENLKKIVLKPTRPVQLVTPESAVPLQPSAGAPNLIRRKTNKECSTLQLKQGHVLKELLETEKIYVDEMETILKGYRDAMQSKDLKNLVPAEFQGKEDVLFGNLNELYYFHKKTFLKDLENCITAAELVALCFVQKRDTFYRLYSVYCQNIPRSEHLRETTVDTKQFLLECQKRLGHKLPLAAYLLKPVQRITKYQLLLKDLLRFSSRNNCYKELQKALNCMLVVLKCVNDSMHQVSIIGFQNELSKQGDLLLQDSFQVWSESKRDIRLRIKQQKRHIFLYQKCIIFCKAMLKSGQNKSMYQFKHYLNMSQIGLTETVRGDNKRFEIWLPGRQEVHTLQAFTFETKQNWVHEIKRVLLNQLEQLKGERIQLDGLQQQPFLLDDSTSFMSQKTQRTSFNNSIENQEYCSQPTVDDKYVPKEPDESCAWSSDCSNSEDEQRLTDESCTLGAKYIALADYDAVGSSEISIQEGDVVELLKMGCAGWWFVRNIGENTEGWTPAAYLELSKSH